MTSPHFVPVLMMPLIAWGFYRRIRRNVGRQSFRPKRTIISLVVLTLVLGLVGFSLILLGGNWWALVGGLAAGVLAGSFGFKKTQFETNAEGNVYTPNTHLGIAISLLLVLRISWRYVLLYVAPAAATSATPRIGQSALTLFLMGLTFGYYITYNALLFVHFKSLGAESKAGLGSRSRTTEPSI